MLTTNGAPNDVINNFNPFAIILFSPILNVRNPHHLCLGECFDILTDSSWTLAVFGPKSYRDRDARGVVLEKPTTDS
jgi:hypothetical protein